MTCTKYELRIRGTVGARGRGAHPPFRCNLPVHHSELCFRHLAHLEQSVHLLIVRLDELGNEADPSRRIRRQAGEQADEDTQEVFLVFER